MSVAVEREVATAEPVVDLARTITRRNDDQSRNHMLRALGLIALVALQGCAMQPRVPADTDAPEARQKRSSTEMHPESYGRALQSWRLPEQLNSWIADTFEYDQDRAMRLSETQRQAHGSLPIYSPGQFFSRPAGVCVDLARFAVETLQAVAPELNAKYVMIEFTPTTIRGNTLRRHWLVSFEREDGLYFFADSKRPGHIAGPYASTNAFIDEYARYRGREVASFRELSSYQRRAKVKAVRQQRQDA